MPATPTPNDFHMPISPCLKHSLRCSPRRNDALSQSILVKHCTTCTVLAKPLLTATMSNTGLVFKDLMPVPDDTQAVTEPDKKEVSQTLREEPTASHALAMADHDVKGVAQQSHGAEVQDLGWNEPKEQIPAPLVGGLENEELWILIRRFNKVCRSFCASD